MNLELVPHPCAPLFSGPDALDTLQEVIREIASGSFGTTEEFRQYFRQAAYVNLWFFLKFCAGYSGPFDELNEDLHVDMCNYRQSLLEPGCRGAMFIPRGHYKSTIVTEGGGAWELLRHPNLRMRVSNAIADKAAGFAHTIKETFEYNDFMVWLFGNPADRWGSYIPVKNQDRWNNVEIVMPNRSRRFREASVEFGGVGGASEGHHYDLHIVDDMIGLQALNSMRGSNAVMDTTRNWFWGSEKTLLHSMRKSRVIVVGTRYAVDDIYDEIISRANVNKGYPLPYFTANPAGRWQIYYRKGIEDGRVIFPENFSLEFYQELAQDDWWTYVTQYMNDPQSSGLAEFVQYDIKSCTVDYSNPKREWFILPEDDDESVALSSCDVIVLGDPAATERATSAKTSRTAIGVLATDPKGRRFYIWIRADYVSTKGLFDWLFEANRTYKGYIRGTFLEQNGPFRMLEGQIREEQQRRNEWIGLRPFTSVGEKTARIRTALDPEFARGQIYVAEPFKLMVMEEARSFPQSHRKDILDMMAAGIISSIKPLSDEEQTEKDLADEQWANRRHNKAGY